MSTIWLGDFRLKQIQQYCALTEDKSTDADYLFDADADYTWFSTTAVAQLPLLYKSMANVVIMCGFADCIYSCTWDSFKIDDIATTYATCINELIKNYSDLSFYVCAVPPINGNYPFTPYKSINKTGIIAKKDLQAKITKFNSTLKKNCTATFIDCYDYLTKTSFSTRDGILYDYDTLKSLKTYIFSCFRTNSAFGNFIGIKRATADMAPKASDDTFIYWQKKGSGSQGVNECIEAAPGSMVVLPNCVGYAWGRFYEIIGERPKLSAGQAEQWYTHTDGYERGKPEDLPREGAVICWQDGKVDGAEASPGHVAIVEQVNSDGTIITSESGWVEPPPTYDPKKHFWVTTRKRVITNEGKSNEKIQWRKVVNGKVTDDFTDSYTFQGFIYAPQTTAVQNEKVAVLAEDKYLSKTIDPPSNDVENIMKPIVQYIWQYLGSRGWSKNAVAALCGNMHEESNMSPEQWEKPSLKADSFYIKNYGSYVTPEPKKQDDGTYWPEQKYVDRICTALDRSKNKVGYGLVQWTSFTKLVKWCNDGKKNGTGKVLPYYEIDSQLARIAWEAATENEQWGLASYNKDYKYKGEAFTLSFKDFTTSTKDAGWLAAAFAYCYEKPGSSDNADNKNDELSVAEEKLNLCTTRDAYASFWYKYLCSLSLLSAEDASLKVTNLKADTAKAGKISASFIAKNSKSYKYSLKKGDTEIKKSSDAIEISDKEIITFDISDSKIIPNTEYSLKITVTGNSDEKVSKEITINVPQDYPGSVQTISLTCADTIKSTDSTFILSATMPSSFGYWEKNTCGYTKQLIVNGKCVASKTVSNIKDIVSESFTIKDVFDYDCKVDDTIQIGIRTWAKDDNKKLIYDSAYAKASSPICLLNNTIPVYLMNN